MTFQIEFPTPVWNRLVAADHAIDENKTFQKGVLNEEVISRLRDVARKNAKAIAQERTPQSLEGCRIYTGYVSNTFKATASLSDLTSSAEVIVSGRVTAMRQGFLYGAPGMLLRLSTQYLKGTGPEIVFLYYPFARIETSDGLVCAIPVGDFAVGAFKGPHVGDRMLAFAMEQPRLIGGEILLRVNEWKHLVHETPESTRIPPALRPLVTPSTEMPFDAIRNAVASELAPTAP